MISLQKKHFVILVPGLGDEVRATGFLTRHFAKHGFIIVVHSVGWRDSEKEFKPKLDRLLKLIDELARKGMVSLIGMSAGGSAVLNAFVLRKKKIFRAVSICARLRVGETTGYRSFASKTHLRPAFAQSIQLFERSEPSLSKMDRKRLMTVRALYDELVPPDTATIDGANNTVISSVEHMLSIALTLSLFSASIIHFFADTLEEE